MTVTLTGRLICANDAEAEMVRAHMPEHARLTREEPGCLKFDVTETDDPLVWQVDEEFASPDDFRFHQERGAASTWGRISEGIKRDFQIKGL